MTNDLVPFAPASNRELSTALMGIGERIEAAARANLEHVLEEDPTYTETEKEAMLIVESLRQVNGLDLAAVLLRAKYLKIIEERNLVARHPGGYTSMSQMAADQGMSISELSQTLDLVNVIFPYVEEHMGISAAQLFETIGKSNLRELVPVMKAIISGEAPITGSARASMEAILDDVAATMRAADIPLETDEAGNLTENGIAELRQRAVAQLLDQGATLTNRQLRAHVRPVRTPAIPFWAINSGEGERTVIASFTDAQWELFQRKMGQAADVFYYTPVNDTAVRQRDLLSIPEVRRIQELME